MEILIEEEGDLYCVCVKIESYNTSNKKKTIVNTSNVRKALVDKGYEVGKAVQESYLHNLNGATQGTWFFEKKVEKQLDKSAEQVIIKEENPAPTKTTRRRRTKSTAKKVSSGE